VLAKAHFIPAQAQFIIFIMKAANSLPGIPTALKPCLEHGETLTIQYLSRIIDNRGGYILDQHQFLPLTHVNYRPRPGLHAVSVA
jgi:hypothetical protein